MNNLHIDIIVDLFKFIHRIGTWRIAKGYDFYDEPI